MFIIEKLNSTQGIMFVYYFVIYVQDKDDHKCGGSYWNAARSTSTSRQKLAETGLEVAGCRHSIAQKAVNMTTGEQYCYPHYLHSQIFAPLGVRFLWQDVICKYWPWAVKLAARKPEFQQAVTAVRPALSVMHAKAHAWHCQVRLSQLQIQLNLPTHILYFQCFCVFGVIICVT